MVALVGLLAGGARSVFVFAGGLCQPGGVGRRSLATAFRRVMPLRLEGETAIVKALVLEAYNKLVVREVPDPVPRDGEVLVEVKACGICGSDVHGMDGSSGRRIPPVIMGHEAAGVIAATGSGVSGWSVGDRVTFDSMIYCGNCHYCREGRTNLCEHRQVPGVSCPEFRRDGAFAQLVAVPQHIVVKLPDTVPFEHAAMAEPLSVAVHAVGRLPIRLGDSAVVIGAGTIGLLSIQALRAAGCTRVIAAEVDPARRELAKQLGADEVFDPLTTDLAEEVARLTAGRGADVVVEAVGLANTVAAAVGCACKGGAVVLVGNLRPEVPLPLQAVVTREITLYGSCASAGEYARCLELIAQGVIRLDRLISATVSLDEAAEYFTRLYHKEPGLLKVIVRP